MKQHVSHRVNDFLNFDYNFVEVKNNIVEIGQVFR